MSKRWYSLKIDRHLGGPECTFNSPRLRDLCASTEVLGTVYRATATIIDCGEGRGTVTVDVTRIAWGESGQLPPLVQNEITGGTRDPADALARAAAPMLHQQSPEDAAEDAAALAEVMNWLNAQRPRPEWRKGHAEWLIECAVYEFGAARFAAAKDAANRAGEEDRRIALGDADAIAARANGEK